MEFLSEAWELIQKLAGPPVVESIPAPSGHGRSLVVKDGYKVQDIAGRRRGRRKHVFDDLRTFASWLNRHVAEGKPREACEILVADAQVVASLAPRERQSDEITCKLVPDPTFSAWKAAFGQELGQRVFYQLARAHGSVLVEREVIVGMLQRIGVTLTSASEEHLDAAGLTKLIKGSRTTDATIAIPSSFKLSTGIIDGLDVKYELEVFLAPTVKDGPALVFGLECPGLPLILRQVRRDVADLLQDTLLEGGFLVGLGTLATEEVPEIQAAS